MTNFRVQAIDRHRLYTDGEGVTTLVALSGCPLQCKYCINKKLLQKPVWKEYTKEALLQVLLQDYCYFAATGGGITFGGGEPLLHSNSIAELIDILPEQVGVNIETSLCVENEKLQILLDKVSHFIIDVKSLDPNIYQSYTGRSNGQVQENLKYIEKCGQQNKCKIRIPNIPGYTNEQNIIDTKKQILSMGFEQIDLFDYVIKTV